jgi:hypothetical protein
VCLALLMAARPASAQSAPPRPIMFGRVVLSGYLQMDYQGALEDEPSDGEPAGGESGAGQAADTESTFSVRRARAGLSGALGKRVTWTLVADLASLPDEAILRDAAVTVRLTPAASIRVGQYTIPFSLERITSTTVLAVIDRSVIGTSLSPSRDVGVTVFSPQPIRGWLTYAASVIHGAGANRADNNDGKDVVGRVAVRVPRVEGLSIGVNGESGEQPLGDRRRHGADISYVRGPFQLAVEAVSQTIGGAMRHETSGYYLFGVWHRPAAQSRRWFAGYELAARWLDVDDDARALTSRGLQLGGNYYVTPQVRIMNNLIVPVGDHQPYPRTRWWSRLQVVF